MITFNTPTVNIITTITISMVTNLITHITMTMAYPATTTATNKNKLYIRQHSYITNAV